MIKRTYIQSLVLEHLQDTDKFLVQVMVKPANKILVFIDSDTNVTIADCVSLSRFIESKLDRETEDFELSVSSSGLDQPLLILRQYIKNLNKLVEVKYSDTEKAEGILLEATSESIKIQTSKTKKKPSEIITIPFSEILETKIKIVF